MHKNSSSNWSGVCFVSSLGNGIFVWSLIYILNFLRLEKKILFILLDIAKNEK